VAGSNRLVEFGRSSDLIKFVLDRPMANAPGQVFNYNSGNPHLLSAIITKLSGMSAWDYAKAKLFAPLGIEVSNWHHDPQGVTTGGGGLVLYPRDMAKIGYLYLRNGEWEGKRLLPAGWTDRVSHATVNMNASFDPELRYANFFLVLPRRQVYMAWGIRCQFIMVFPAQDMVAVATARAHCPFGKLADDISGAVKSEAALAPNPAGAKFARRQNSGCLDREADGGRRDTGNCIRHLRGNVPVSVQRTACEIAFTPSDGAAAAVCT
jgi:CubicO group peptidase (beta-lactamase class C family)